MNSYKTRTEKVNEKFILSFSDIEAMQKSSDYYYLKSSIGQSKGMNVTNKDKEVIAKIFIPELAYILTHSKVQYTECKNEKLRAKVLDREKETKYFDGTKFFGYYTEAYRKGEQDFEKDFGVDTNTLYGAHAERYVSTIHYNYFHADIKGKVSSSIGEGWNNWRKSYPTIITKEAIAEYGYYSGFIGKVWALATKHPQQFRDLDKCKLSEHTKKKSEQADTSELKSEKNYFCNSMPLSIAREHFKVFTETKSKNKEPFLTVEQFNLFIDRAFCGKNNLPKQKFNQAPKGEKLLIQTVFYEFYNQYCFEYFNTMQCQEDFIKLLTENFEGWDFKNVQQNFTPKTKKRL